MARLKFGIWGPMIGKLANTVGYLRKGIAMVRMKPKPSVKKRTNKQKATTQRFQTIIKFVATINDFTNAGFNVAARKVSPTAQNLAVSYNTKNAMVGEYPNQQIDYSKVRVCEGKLPLADDINITLEDHGNDIKILFSWEPGSTDYPRSRDQVMMLAYMPERMKGEFLDSGARRLEGHDSLTIKKKTGNVYRPDVATYAEVYIAFVANDRNSISNSLYCGRFDF